MISQSPKGIQYTKSLKVDHITTRFENEEEVNDDNTVLIEFFKIENGVKLQDFYETAFIFDKNKGLKHAYKYVSAACSIQPPKLHVILAQNCYNVFANSQYSQSMLLKISACEKTGQIKIDNLVPNMSKDTKNQRFLLTLARYFTVNHNGK